MKRKLDILAAHGETVGRDVSEIEISTEVRSLTPVQADELHGLGTTLFTVGISGPDYPLDGVKKWLAWRDATNGS
jgi:hypothetical protein